MLEYYFSCVLQKPLRLDVIRIIYHSACQYTAFKRGVDLSPDERSFVATRILVTRVPASNLYEMSLQLCLFTCESRDPRHGLSVSNGVMRTLGTTKFEHSNAVRCIRRIVAATRNTPPE